MAYDFDHVPDRRNSDSLKWRSYDPDVLPLWVADMDFPAPEPVIAALRQRVEHGVYGYRYETGELHEAVVERLQRLYGWQVTPEAILLLPGVINGFNLACRAVANPGEEVLVQTPVYPPILRAGQSSGLARRQAPLVQQADGHYGIAWEAFEEAITPRTRAFLLCNPHNPVGRVWREDELAHMAEICLRHGLTIISDEIHCDLVFPPHRHRPIAALDPAIEARTVTLIAPSKTFNIAGLQCALAIIPDPSLRRQVQSAGAGLVGGVNLLGFTAALAAYRHGQPWLEALLAYLQANRDLLVQYVREHLPGVRLAAPEGTFLAWLDCRNLALPGGPFRFFLERARVALNDGPTFGAEGEGFVRLNFGCPRALLVQALERMRAALAVEHVARIEPGAPI